ncbi:hypothetical protein QRE66_12250 [Bacillus cereus]|nr:hypothetical protein QRE66_12250 [Bacillus cereus]
MALVFNHTIGRKTEQKELYLEFIQSIVPEAAERLQALLYEKKTMNLADIVALNTG